jgi:dihydrodipicolinate synthase/N-acetylneuraminate lyase
MESMNIGTHGVISVAANVIPKSISNICKFMKNDSSDEARLLNINNSNLYKLLFTESNPIPVKWMLYRMGLIQNAIRLPLIELDRNFHDEITSEMLKLELL